MESRQAIRSLACSSVLFLPSAIVVAGAGPGVGVGISGVGSVCQVITVLGSGLLETTDNARILLCSTLFVPSVVVVTGAGVGLGASGVGSLCRVIRVLVSWLQETADSARIIDRSEYVIGRFILLLP
jgi:acetyl-CoA carboxylase alpha subunit